MMKITVRPTAPIGLPRTTWRRKFPTPSSSRSKAKVTTTWRQIRRWRTRPFENSSTRRGGVETRPYHRRQPMLKAKSSISRRDFLKFTAKTAVVSSGLLSRCASMSSGGAGKTASAIDIHHHYIPLELIEEVKSNGKTLGVEYFPPKDAKDNPLQIRFPKGNRLNPDPRMAEMNNRLDAITKG